MALTITQTKRNSVSGSKITAYVNVTFDNSYPAGGEAFDATIYGVGTPDSVDIRLVGPQATKIELRYDATNKKLQAYGSTTEASGAEVQAPAAVGAGGLALLELANASALLATLVTEITITGGR